MREQINGEYVPEIEGHDVGDEKVDVVGSVDRVVVAAASMEGVAAVLTSRVCGLNLDAVEVSAGLDDEIVRVAVAPGFGDAESEAGGFVKKGGFGEFAAAFAIDAGCLHRQNKRRGLVAHAWTFLNFSL